MTGWSAPASFPAALPAAPVVPAAASTVEPDAPPWPVVAPGVTPAQPAATASAIDERTHAAFPDRKRKRGAIVCLLVTVRYPNGVRRPQTRLTPRLTGAG